MRIVKLSLVSMLIFVVLAASYLNMPSNLKYEITDWFGRLTAPSFDMPLDEFTGRDQSDVIKEFESRGYKLNCFGNLRPEEKIGKFNDYLCWGLTSSAFDNIPARSFALFFYQNKLIHVRMEFPESSLEKIQNYLNVRLKDKTRLDSLPGSHFGVDENGKPLMVWQCKAGIIIASWSVTHNQHVVVVWSSKESIILQALAKKLENN